MIRFGTGGWRAIIGDEFTKENIQILSRAICDKMKEEKVAEEGIVLGYDRRFLSKEAMQATVIRASYHGGTHRWHVNWEISKFWDA